MLRTSPSRRVYDVEKDQIPFLTYTQTDNDIESRKVQIGEYLYDMDDVLGQGYTSTVYKAVWVTNPKQLYAIKVIDLKKFKHDSSLALLDMEVEIVLSIRHPNIIECMDVFKSKKFYYLAFQYCPYGDLQELIKFQKVITEDRAIEIMKQIIAGYKYLISKNIIHRDLKPANIMCFGNKWKIADFGFARYCKSEYILDKVHVGTPLYLAPESLSMSKYSFKGDLFALGVIFYEMLTGETPWPSQTEKKLLKKMMKGGQIQIPESIVGEEVKFFLKRSLEIEFYNRMTKDEFKKFSFDHINPEITKLRPLREVSPIKRSISESGEKDLLLTPTKVEKLKHTRSSNYLKITQRVQVQQKSTTNLNSLKKDLQPQRKTLITVHSVRRQNHLNLEKGQKFMLKVEEATQPDQQKSEQPSIYESVDNSSLNSQIYRSNAKLMYTEIDFLRFVMNLTHNIHSLLLDRKQRTQLVCLLCRFCKIDLKMLMNIKFNILSLQKWDSFIKTDRYQKVIDEAQQYLKKYEKWLTRFENDAHKGTVNKVKEIMPDYEEVFFNFRSYAKIFNSIRDIVCFNIIEQPVILVNEDEKKNFYAGISQLIRILKIFKNRTSNRLHQEGIGLRDQFESPFRESSPEMKEYQEELIQKQLSVLANLCEEEIIIPEPPVISPLTL